MSGRSTGQSPLSPLKQAYLKLEELQARLARSERRVHEPIAVIGIGCRLPGGVVDPLTYWRLLSNGIDATCQVPAGRWDLDRYYDPDPDAPGKTHVRRGGYLDGVDLFDPQFFGISPREAAEMDPQQRLLLEVAWEAFEHAGEPPRSLEGSRTGVFVAVATNDYLNLQVRQDDLTRIGLYHGAGIARSVASGRIAYVFGLQGPAISVDTACSSSLVAIHLACQSIRDGESRMAIAGGVNVILSGENRVIFAKSKLLAADGRCKTFDASADGLGEGEGCALVVLKRLADAVADGSRVLAVIRGTAANQDGASSGLTAPNGTAQEALIRQAVAAADVKPAEIGYVETHGTGTTLGDPIEVRALAAALGDGRDPRRPLWIGSVKTNFGHLEAAAGVAGLVKVVLSLAHRTIPPHLHFRTPNPLIPWSELPVAVPTSEVAWTPIGGRRIGGVSAFGFSGTNVHVVLEEAPPPASDEGTTRPAHVLALSARTPSALRQLGGRFAERLRDLSPADVADVCHSANPLRSHEGCRLAVVGATGNEMRKTLETFAETGEPAEASAGALESSDRPKIAFVFAGHGSQHAGMARLLYDTEPTFRRALERCAEILAPHLDEPLLTAMYRGGPEAGGPDRVSWAQPAIVAVEFALAALWQSWGVGPSAVVGVGLGEYTAACVSGACPLEEVLPLVAARARLLESLSSDGASRPEEIAASPASHAAFPEPVLDALETAARTVRFGAPQLPMASSVTGALVRDALDAGYRRRHMGGAPRVADALRTLHGAGVRVFLEIGPDSTLADAGRRALPADGHAWLSSLERGRDDSRAMLRTVGALYVRGVAIDWKGLDRDHRRALVDVPGYPFERQRYWFDMGAATSPRSARREGWREDAHPLLQRRLQSAIGIFEADLNLQSVPFLADHRIRGRVVLPAAAYLEALRAASAATLGCEAIVLEDVVIGEPLALADDERRTMQVAAMPAGSDEAALRVFSAGPAGGEAWRLHATARARAAAPAATVRVDDMAHVRCAEGTAPEHLYRAMSERGLDLGPAFRGVEALRCGPLEAMGRLVATEEVRANADRYGVHPALLDAALQVLGAALPDAAGTTASRDTYLPIGIDRVAFHRCPGGGRLISHVSLHPFSDPSPETLAGDVRLADETGAVLVEILGLRLKRLRPDALTSGDEIDGWLYQVEWERRELDRGGGAPADGLADRFRAGAQDGIGSPGIHPGLARYDELLPELAAAAGGWVARAMRALGWTPAPGDPVSADQLAARLDVVPRHRRLLGRLLEILAEDGFLESNGRDWIVRREPDAADPAGSVRALATRFPEYEAEIALLQRCGPALAQALRGEADPLELLFPGGDLSTAERLYEQSPVARAYNGLVRTAVLSAVESLGPNRTVRILEIGGGTGGTTSGVLPALAGRCAEYVFTDISRAFTTSAATKFQEYRFVQYRTLDIEHDPGNQGFDGERFDVVLAANVLHATRDLRETLSHVRQLLASDGVLVLLEMTRPQRDIEVIFGLTDGWWRFTDDDLRPASLLMPSRDWVALLRDSAFRNPLALPEETDRIEGSAAGQTVIVARAPAAALEQQPVAPAWLILEDAGGCGRALAQAITAARGRAVRAGRGPSFARLADDHVVMNPEDSADYRRTLNLADTWRGVVHLWSLDATPGEVTAEILASEQRLGMRSVLALIQAIAKAGVAPGRLVIGTRGAQSRGPETGLRLSPATAWGLAKVVALEHPELRCLRIDLDPRGSGEEMAEFAAELAADGPEDQVMLRGGERFVARLSRAPAVPEREQGRPIRFEVGRRGLLDTIAARPAERRAPGAGEVEIRVHATGLNFRDVMGAMGVYPGDPGPLGSECAGTIAAVGPGVDSLHVGDEVLAIVPGCLATYVTGPAHFVRRRPPGLSVEQAASFAIPYLTAAFALDRVAGLRPGERVLIHSAAGGVGLAALHLAQRAGADVYATAGSDEKRAYLASLGVSHVYDSRSTVFAGAVLAETGGRGVDVVLNSLGREFVRPGLSVLAPGGRFVEIAKTGLLSADERRALGPDIRYHAVDWSETARETPAVIQSMLEDLIARAASGELNPLPVRTFAAADASEAFRFMAQARHIGKIVITQPHEGDASAWSVRPEATYLVTGGLRGIGLLVAEHLAARGARHLLLMGRRPPEAGALETIARLERQGVTVMAAQADVSKRDEVARELARAAASLPPLAGVVHAAGVLSDSVLQRLDWARAAEVLAPKVQGAWNLAELTRGASLDFFVLFSSIAGLLGSPGQGNHAAANAFLDTLAHHLRTNGVPATSIDWGAWSEVGAAAERHVGGRLATQGVEPIPPALGLRAFDAVAGRGVPQVAVTPMRWPAFLESFAAGSRPPFLARMVEEGRRVRTKPARLARAPEQAPADIRSRLESAPPSKRRSLLVGYVRERAARVLGLRAPESIDQNQPLSELGLDSLMAIELRNLLASGLGLKRGLPATVVFDYPSVQALAGFLETELASESTCGQGRAAGPSPAIPAPADALDSIEELSDEEVDRLFAERVGQHR